MNTNGQSVILKLFFIWLLAYVVMGAMVITPLLAQTQDNKGFIVTGSKDVVQSLASTQGIRWALLIGIADYPSSEGFEVQKLRGPVNDVNALAAFLKDPKKGNFDADHVFTLTDDQATRRNILISFNEITNNAEPEDMVIFYFSGHGTRQNDNGTTYLIPYDYDLRDIEATGIEFNDLAKKIMRMKANKVVVILDACHSGGVKSKGARATTGPEGIVKRYLEAFQTSEGRALLLSSDESEVSWETEENGVFTRFLLDGLHGKADKNEDGIVTFTEVALYVEAEVPEYTHENFPRVQKPTRRYELGQVRGDIPMAINWPEHEEFRQKHQELLDKRNAVILRASLAGLDQTLKDFSLRVTGSAYSKALNDEQLTEQEKLLLPEIDALKDGAISAADYITRARAIHSLGASPQPVKPVTTTRPDEVATPPSDNKPFTIPQLPINIQPFTPSQPPVTTGSEEIVVKGDMVLIPTGEFQMGDGAGAHKVYLGAFYIDKYEVTNGQYRKFIEAIGHRQPTYWNDPSFNTPDQPVVGVSWDDANAYCQWAGKRLPTEAEWEKAARGGLEGMKYPWGSSITHDDANYLGTGNKDKWSYPAPVGSFAPNGYGLYDMAGNVWEWCSDWYDANYYSKSPEQNPKGPDSGSSRVLRGGCWNLYPDYLQVSRRHYRSPTYRDKDLGFRCARDTTP